MARQGTAAEGAVLSFAESATGRSVAAGEKRAVQPEILIVEKRRRPSSAQWDSTSGVIHPLVSRRRGSPLPPNLFDSRRPCSTGFALILTER